MSIDTDCRGDWLCPADHHIHGCYSTDTVGFRRAARARITALEAEACPHHDRTLFWHNKSLGAEVLQHLAPEGADGHWGFREYDRLIECGAITGEGEPTALEAENARLRALVRDLALGTRTPQTAETAATLAAVLADSPRVDDSGGA